MTAELKAFTFRDLQEAVKKGAALRARIRLQADGGDGGKVFPPTYAGGVYAVEDRRIDGRVVRCVLLDSVQSQANRMEEAIQDAFLPNWRELPYIGDEGNWAELPCDLPVLAVRVGSHDWVTSLTAPHRVHDAILRDSEVEETMEDRTDNSKTDEQGKKRQRKRFRESDIGQALVKARVWNATAFYQYCPTALLFGTWDSTAGEGLDSAKVPRAIVSEIVGVDITPGVRTASRIDPLGIGAGAATVYRRTDGDWAAKIKTENGDDQLIGAATEDELERDKKGNPKKFGKGKPSDVNHSNVTPNLPRFERKEINDNDLNRLADILESNPLEFRCDVRSQDSRLESYSAFRSDHLRIREGAVKPGGTTMAYALHTWTLSLTQLRRLRFPRDDQGKKQADQEAEAKTAKQHERDEAARTVLATLALFALALLRERGYWLRSRCELIPQMNGEACPATLELINVDGKDEKFMIPDVATTRQMLRQACEAAGKILNANSHDSNTAPEHANAESLPDPGWMRKVIQLKPTEKLAQLVQASDRRMAIEQIDEREAASADNQG